MGFEPITPGLQNRGQHFVTSLNTDTCEDSQAELTPQLTPEGRNAAEMGISKLTPDVAEIVTVWAKLPEHVKAAIRTLVRAHASNIDRGEHQV